MEESTSGYILWIHGSHGMNEMGPFGSHLFLSAMSISGDKAERVGDIDEHEFVNNLKRCPKLHAVMSADVDPDWGTRANY